MKTPRIAFLVFVLGAWTARTLATTVILPVEAIDDFWHLAADDFRQKYGGITITGLGVDDQGWYVRYRHENLTYFFGPLQERDEARRKMWELEAVRDAVIRERPSLAASKVDFVRFDYSGIFGARGDTPFSGKSRDGKNGPDGDLDGDGIPNAKDDDMDGDGIPNAKDADMDGDGIPNAQDSYPYGKSPAELGELAGTGKDGEKDGGLGQEGEKPGGAGDKTGGSGQDGDKQGGQGGQQQQVAGTGNEGSQKSGTGNESGGQGKEKNQAGQQGGQQRQQVAAIPSGSQRGQQGKQQGQQQGQAGQSGQAGQQGQPGQPGQPSQSSGQGSGQPGMPGTPSPQGGGSPVDLILILLRKILGLG